jgi:hypothetical protein
MKVNVVRRWRIPAPPGGEAGTKGELSCDWGLKGFTLEDEVRMDPDPSTPENEAKVYGKTAVPAGTYRLYLRYSPHFQRELPHFDPPGFTDTMIHGANTPVELKGCIAVGRRLQPFGDCAPVVNEIVSQLRLAEERSEESSITIEEGFADPT